MIVNAFKKGELDLPSVVPIVVEDSCWDVDHHVVDSGECVRPFHHQFGTIFYVHVET